MLSYSTCYFFYYLFYLNKTQIFVNNYNVYNKSDNKEKMMEIIDLKKILDKNLEPVCKLEGKLFLRETVKVYDDLFKDSDIINYYNYDIENKEMTSINIGKEKILLDFFQQKEVEGENGFYYVTFKKQLLINEYTLNSVNINTSEITTVFKFEMDKKFDNLLVEKLDDG